MTLPRPALLLLISTLTALAAEKPNLIVIMADDLGFGDISCNGSTTIQTPNIDRVAAEGLRFTSGYCSASTCTPTRYSLLTGTYALRVNGTGIAPPNGPALIKPGTPTIASLLKSQGYATAVIGKWHLGLGSPKPDWNGELKPGPLEIGFDHCLLLPTTNDRVPQVFVEDHRVRNLDPADPLWVGDDKPSADHPTGETHRSELKMDWSHGHNNTIHNGISRIGFYTGGAKARFRDQDLGDEWVNQSKSWIRKHKDQPFFLFFASHDIHVPRAPHERFLGKSGMGPRGDAILEFDWCVGEIMRTLAECGIERNTMVVICSDNGPVLDDGYKDQAVEKLGAHQPAGPFSGGKYSVQEGGTRTPFITWWKGRIQPGVSDQVVCTIDLAASFGKLTGANLPDEGFLDSSDVLGALLGEPEARGREVLLQQGNTDQRIGLRVGRWKMIVERNRKDAEVKRASLYRIDKDPAEQKDLAKEEPEQLAHMQLLLDQIIATGRTRSVPKR
ncbi:MAG TPA: arylsulfatase [Luteolibacter sp.]|nr:arylsulfatase [Luteolibacter sp.]